MYVYMCVCVLSHVLGGQRRVSSHGTEVTDVYNGGAGINSNLNQSDKHS